MPRGISAAFRRSLEEPRSDDYPVILLEISHESLSNPIRVANDVVSYSYQNNTYIGFPFEFEIVGDSEQVPRGQLRIQNVDQRISDAVLSLTTPPRVDLLIFASSDFSETLVDGVRPSIETDPVPEYSARHLIFGNITVDVVAIAGEIKSFDMSNEPWPAPRTTADRLPGLEP